MNIDVKLPRQAPTMTDEQFYLQFQLFNARTALSGRRRRRRRWAQLWLQLQVEVGRGPVAGTARSVGVVSSRKGSKWHGVEVSGLFLAMICTFLHYLRLWTIIMTLLLSVICA